MPDRYVHYDLPPDPFFLHAHGNRGGTRCECGGTKYMDWDYCFPCGYKPGRKNVHKKKKYQMTRKEQ